METKTILKITSPAFENNGQIPEKFTCDGLGVNPPLTIRDLPKETPRMALIMEDPDAPGGTFCHWLMWNIPPVEGIEENSAPGVLGVNSAGQNKYMGPCPPSGIHRYCFRIYALKSELTLAANSGRDEFLAAIRDHIIGCGELIGLYERKTQKR